MELKRASGREECFVQKIWSFLKHYTLSNQIPQSNSPQVLLLLTTGTLHCALVSKLTPNRARRKLHRVRVGEEAVGIGYNLPDMEAISKVLSSSRVDKANGEGSCEAANRSAALIRAGWIGEGLCGTY
jgi:hypothetical protein